MRVAPLGRARGSLLEGCVSFGCASARVLLVDMDKRPGFEYHFGCVEAGHLLSAGLV